MSKRRREVFGLWPEEDQDVVYILDEDGDVTSEDDLCERAGCNHPRRAHSEENDGACVTCRCKKFLLT